MDIFFSQRQLINCFEGAALGKLFDSAYGLACYNKNLIKFYLLSPTGDPILVYTDYLLENIIQLERYPISSEKDGILILFESSKIVLLSFVNYSPRTESLKYFEKDEFDLRKNDLRFIRMYEHLGMAKLSKYWFAMVSLNSIAYKTSAFRFTDIDDKIKNVIDYIFLDNYSTPTICLIYNATQCSYVHKKDVEAIIFSYDAKSTEFNVMEEFHLPPDTHKILFKKNTLIFISHNDIIFRTSNSCYGVGLNKMAQTLENILCDVILHEEIAFFEEDALLIFNGDGTLLKFVLFYDSKRIIKVTMKNLGKCLIAKFITDSKDYVFIGSDDTSLICKKKIVKLNQLHDKILNVCTELDTAEEIEYRNIFCNNFSNSSTHVLKFEIVHRFHGIGGVADFFYIVEKNYIFTTNGVVNGIVKASKQFDFNEINSIDIDKDVFSFMIEENKLFALSAMNTYEITKDLTLAESFFIDTNVRSLAIKIFKGDTYQISNHKGIVYRGAALYKTFELNSKVIRASFWSDNDSLAIICLDNTGLLTFYDHNFSEIEQINNVASFCLGQNICKMIINDSLVGYNMYEAKFEYLIENISNLDNVVMKAAYNSTYLNNSEQKNTIFAIFQVDLALSNYLFLILQSGECIVYAEIDNTFLKVNTSTKLLKFDVNRNIYISLCLDFVFMNTVKPVLMGLTRNDPTFYDCPKSYKCMCYYQGKFYVSKGNNIAQCEHIRQNIQCVVDNNELFENTDTYNNLGYSSQQSITKCKADVNTIMVLYDTLIYKKYPCLRTPKNIVAIGNYYVIASCIREVYKSDLDIDQGVEVETYRYYIDLYNKDCIFIASYDLDADEYVYDLKYLSLNDPVGKKGKSDFLVVCTTKIEGEDKQSRGRLIVLELTSIVADASHLHIDKKLKLFAAENIKGCITKCDEIKGNIAVCLGIKLMVFKIDRSEGLVPIAIHDLYTLSTSISVIKNYVLVSDLYRGLSFFYYQKKPIRLNLLCTSEPIQNVMCADFLIKGSEVSFVSVDFNGNFVIYTYSPNNILAEGGTRMVKRYSIMTNLGLQRKRISISKLNTLCFVSITSFMTRFVGVSSKLYIMLLKLQSQILVFYQHSLGLQPHNFVGTRDHNAPVSLKKPIFGILIEKFLRFDLSTRHKILMNIDVDETELYEFLLEEFDN